ncbi:hypothetical protein HPS174_0258 [Glaesserella parasuis 174]|nr:hypothetical protein HPS174_0258 [Glaesserella parasuis 174]
MSQPFNCNSLDAGYGMQTLRVSIGLAEENDRFFMVLRKALIWNGG